MSRKNEWRRFKQITGEKNPEKMPDMLNFDPCVECEYKKSNCKCRAWQAWFTYRWRNAVMMIRGE